jgi:ABC-type transport system involved in multi-copper enzyme maturation permease subunit
MTDDVVVEPTVIDEAGEPRADDAPIETHWIQPAGRRTRPQPVRALRHLAGGISAVGVKELRGRMRGRRAFVVLTLYLLLLAGFAWMYELILERQYNTGLGGSAAFASAAIGQELFAGLMMLVTLLVVLLAPAFTSGAISLEREKQTLDLLVTTPISSLAIVVGKLLSALTWVFVLIGASVPLTAMVFVFGGVAPDDVVRGYIVLVATALGLGSFGLFCSTLVKRTQAATVITTFGVMAMTLGSIFILGFWGAMTGVRFGADGPNTGFGPIKGRPPQVVAYFNPFVAQADIVCGTQTTYSQWCSQISTLLNGNTGVVVFSGVDEPAGEPAVVDDVGFRGGVEPARVAAAAVQPFGVVRDGFWPRSVAAWLVLSAVLITLSVQLVSPTRRWRPNVRGRAPRRST